MSILVEILQRLDVLLRITRRIETNMATQADIDAIATTVENVSTELTAASARITTEITTLEAEIQAGQPADLTALKSAVDSLSSVANAVDAIVPSVPVTSVVDTPPADPAATDTPPAA